MNTYTIERNFNDFGPRATSIGFVGKTEVTILDNLNHIAQLLHGRILVSSTIPGGFRAYIQKQQLLDLIATYNDLNSYRLSQDLPSLISSLESLITNSNTEISIDNRIVLLMINVHNNISINLKDVWDGVVSLRLLSYSGFNKDITIDGNQQTLNAMLAKFTSNELQFYKPIFERSGQLAGIKSPRQVEMKDMISDLIFSRKDSYVTLNQLFHTTISQRNDLRKFRTDILFCPANRYNELDSGLLIKPLVSIVTAEGSDKVKRSTIKPKGFDYTEFKVRNQGTAAVKISVTGSIGIGTYTIQPLQSISLYGTSLVIPEDNISSMIIEPWSDIRQFNSTEGSIVSSTLDGKLESSLDLSNIFFQVIEPIMPYLPSLMRKLQNSSILITTISKLPLWAQTLISRLQPGYFYSGWLLTEPTSRNERILYIYMLTMMLPEFLLDPTFTFSDTAGTPPYIHEYSLYAANLRKLYE